MQKLKLTPVANAKKLNRNELKNIFGGFGSDGDFGSSFAEGKGRCYSSSIECYNNGQTGHCQARTDDRCVCVGDGWAYFATQCVR